MTSAPPRSHTDLALAPVFLAGAGLTALAATTSARLTWHLPADDWISMILLNIVYWVTWTLLAPLVLSLGMRFRFEAGLRRKAFLVHVAAGLVFAMTHIAVVTIAAAAIQSAVTARPWAETWGAMRFPNRMHIEWEITIYWALVGLAHAIVYKRDADQRAINAAQLEAQLARAQWRALQRQVQPHFVFNTLQTISGLVRGDAAAAEHMLQRLADLLRMTLRAGDGMEVPLSHELEHTRTYLDIARANMGDRLTVEFDVPPDLQGAAVPSLLLQPLVENAVRHGLAPRARGGTIIIAGERIGHALELRVIDDGLGLGEVTTGIGIANTSQRLEQLYGSDHQFGIANRASGGAQVTIRVPYRECPVESPEEVSCRA